MNYWIFQSKMEQYDLARPGNLLSGKKHSWPATRYRTDMHAGDVVFFWQAGPPEIRGIYGWGTIASKPYQRGEKFTVDVICRSKLLEPLNVEVIATANELRNLLILRLAVGSNFLISQHEGEAIVRLMPSTNRPEVN